MRLSILPRLAKRRVSYGITAKEQRNLSFLCQARFILCFDPASLRELPVMKICPVFDGLFHDLRWKLMKTCSYLTVRRGLFFLLLASEICLGPRSHAAVGLAVNPSTISN